MLLCQRFFCTHLILLLVVKIFPLSFQKVCLTWKIHKYLTSKPGSSQKQENSEINGRAGAAFWKREAPVQNGRVGTYEGGTVTDFDHSFCPTLRHLKNATPPYPLPLSGMCFLSFGSIYQWLEKLGFLVNESPSSSKQVQENFVHPIILYLLLWPVTYKVKVFVSPCTKSNRSWKEKCWNKFRYSYIQYFFLWQ